MIYKDDLSDEGSVHTLKVKLKGFPNPFFFTVASEEITGELHKLAQVARAGFICFRNERGSKRYVGINCKFIQYVRFRHTPSNVAREDEPHEGELRDVRLWLDGEAEPHGFGSDSMPHEAGAVDPDWGDLESIFHYMMTYEGDDREDCAHVLVDDGGEGLVYRENHLVMIDTDAKLLNPELFDEWFEAMDDKHVEVVNID